MSNDRTNKKPLDVVIGKAPGSLDKGTGAIQMLVVMQEEGAMSHVFTLRRLSMLLIAMLLLLASFAIVRAQTGSGYDLNWSTIDGGGAESIGSGYALIGTIGQSDTGAELDGGGYMLIGGFWNDSVTIHITKVYLPIILH